MLSKIKHFRKTYCITERTPKSKAFSSSRETKTQQSSNEKSLKQRNVSELSGTL